MEVRARKGIWWGDPDHRIRRVHRRTNVALLVVVVVDGSAKAKLGCPMLDAVVAVVAASSHLQRLPLVSVPLRTGPARSNSACSVHHVATD